MSTDAVSIFITTRTGSELKKNSFCCLWNMIMNNLFYSTNVIQINYRNFRNQGRSQGFRSEGVETEMKKAIFNISNNIT